MSGDRRARCAAAERLPGFGLSLGFTLFYLSAIVLVPLLALVIRPWSNSASTDFWSAISAPRVVAALRLSFGAALAAAAIDTVFGFIIAWVLVRYRFPGKRLMDALIDLPFALPTAVAGIALSTLYAPNGMDRHVCWPRYGIRIAYTPWGVLVAMMFIGLPFVGAHLAAGAAGPGPRVRGGRRDLGRDALADDPARGSAYAVSGASDRGRAWPSPGASGNMAP